MLDTSPHVFPTVSDHVLLLEQQARPEIAMIQDHAIRQLMAPPPEQNKSPIGLPMTNARKSRRWRDGNACGTKSIAMLTRFVLKVGAGGTAMTEIVNPSRAIPARSA